MHPEAEFKLWSNEDAIKLLAEDFPWLIDTYHAFKRDIHRIDMIRCCILYKYGGVYSDIDLKCLRNIDHYLEKYDVLLAREDRYNSGFTNYFMAAIPNHPLFNLYLLKLGNTAHSIFNQKESAIAVLYATGPQLLTETVYNYSKDKVAPYLGENALTSILPSEIGMVNKNDISHDPAGSWLNIPSMVTDGVVILFLLAAAVIFLFFFLYGLFTYYNIPCKILAFKENNGSIKCLSQVQVVK